MTEHAPINPIALTGDIVSAYLRRNPVYPGDLGELISVVHGSLVALVGQKPEAVRAAPAAPAVSIKKSMTDDYLVCLEDGKKFKTLKRHLQTKYGMTPQEYRAKWSLPGDYPMVAPGYTLVRSNLAKSIGLGSGGRRRPSPGPDPVSEPALLAVTTEGTAAPKRRGRSKEAA